MSSSRRAVERSSARLRRSPHVLKSLHLLMRRPVAPAKSVRRAARGLNAAGRRRVRLDAGAAVGFLPQMSATIRAAKADGSAVWTLLGISFAYGIFHAAGPATARR